MRRSVAFLMVLMAAAFWAGSGLAAQEFFARSDCDAMRLTNIRMILAGVLLLPLAWQRGGVRRSLRVLREEPRLWVEVALYAVVGILFMQYSYFQGIAIGNAAATTVIQYTCPAMVICYESLSRKRWPTVYEVAAVALAVLGILLMVTGGDMGKLTVPAECIIWSLASGAFFAFSAIFPRHLLAKMDQVFLLSVGMLLGGLCSCFLVSQLDWRPFCQPDVWWLVAYIIVMGTSAAFLLFNAGLIYLTPEEATVISTAEPAASVVLSSLIFGTFFGVVELLGILMVLGAILVPLLGGRRGCAS